MDSVIILPIEKWSVTDRLNNVGLRDASASEKRNTHIQHQWWLRSSGCSLWYVAKNYLEYKYRPGHTMVAENSLIQGLSTWIGSCLKALAKFWRPAGSKKLYCWSMTRMSAGYGVEYFNVAQKWLQSMKCFKYNSHLCQTMWNHAKKSMTQTDKFTVFKMWN